MLKLRSFVLVTILMFVISGIAMGADGMYRPDYNSAHNTNFWGAGAGPEGTIAPNGSNEDSIVWMYNRFDSEWGGFDTFNYKDGALNNPDEFQRRYWDKDSARSVNSGFAAHDCDAASRFFEIYNNAEVAQWMVFNMTAVRKDWQIAKPGIFASKLGEFTIMSNDDVDVVFESEGFLAGIDSSNQGSEIKSLYAWGSLDESTPPGLDRFKKNLSMDLDYPGLFNRASEKTFEEIEADGLSVAPTFGRTLWSLLVIEDGTNGRATKSGKYSGTAKFTVTMQAARPSFQDINGAWLDSEAK